MGVACSSDGGEERRVQGFGGETPGKETTGETEVWMRRWIFKKWDEGVWTGLS
jgi:hypothetical protein